MKGKGCHERRQEIALRPLAQSFGTNIALWRATTKSGGAGHIALLSVILWVEHLSRAAEFSYLEHAR